MRFSVGAVNVATGNFVYFDNDTHEIRPEHIMASGALPPGFPRGRDRGRILLGRRPRLQHAAAMGSRKRAAPGHAGIPGRPVERARACSADARRGRDAAEGDPIFQPHARELGPVQEGAETAKRARRTLRSVPDRLKTTEEFALLRPEAGRNVYNIIQLIYRSKQYEEESKDFEFSRQSMDDHWIAGLNDTVRTLRHPEVLERPDQRRRRLHSTFDVAAHGRMSMNASEVRERAFAMPLTQPAYPLGPYRFYDREFLIITYRTDPKKLRDIVPEPLEIYSDVVKFEFIRMPNSTGFGDYTEAGQVIPVRFKGRRATTHSSCSSTTIRRSPRDASCGAFPKKLAGPSLRVETDTLVGTLDYGPVRVATGTMGYKHREADAEATMSELAAPNFLLKIIPHVDGTARICELVEYHLEEVRAERRLDRPGRPVAQRACACTRRRTSGARNRVDRPPGRGPDARPRQGRSRLSLGTHAYSSRRPEAERGQWLGMQGSATNGC